MCKKQNKKYDKERHCRNIEAAQKIPREKILEIYENTDWEKVKKDLEGLGLDLQGEELVIWKNGWEEWQARGPRHEGPYVPPPNPPAIIKAYREKMGQRNDDVLVGLYYKYMTKIQDKTLSLEKRLMYCSLSFSLLEPLIKNCLENYGWFDIKKIPALEFAIREFIDQGIKGQILNIRDIVNYFPELKPWSIYLDKKLAKAGDAG